MAATVAALVGAVTVASAQPPYSSPRWSELTPHERQTLAPLAPEWDRLDAQRKSKWRGIAERYSRMPPHDQERIQQQMRPWSQLSPQERASAREQYKTLRELPPEQRQRWEQYRSLPPEERREYSDRARPQGPPPGGRIPAPGINPPPGERGPGR